MSDSSVQPQQEKVPRYRRWLARFFSFRNSTVVAIVALSTLFVWPIFDASYRYVSWLVRVNVGLERVTAADPAVDAAGITAWMLSIANEWGRLGLRVKLLYLLYTAAFVASIAVIVQARRKKSAVRFVIAVGLLCCWLGLFGSRSTIEHWSIRQQALSVLPKIETTATALIENWPAKSTRIPPDVDVVVSAERYPNTLIVTGRRSYPIREDFGHTIERSPVGAIRFALRGAYDCTLEYHPADSQPATYTSEFGSPSPKIVSAIQLKKHWYLVRYGTQ